MLSMHKTISPPAGMRVVPCTGVDLGFRDILAAIGLVINARLDSDKLEETLWKLVEHKFPRAGSRLAYRDGAYEFQIPEKFDAEAPPFVLTVEDHPEVYNCGTRPQIPHTFTGSKPSVIPAPELERFFRSKTCPTSLHGFLQGMEWDAQPLKHFGSSTSLKPAVPRGWFILAGFSWLWFFLRVLYRTIPDPKTVTRFVRVPKVFLNEAKQNIMHELKAQGSSEYVGSSDVLAAFWLKTAYGHRRPMDHTPIHPHIYRDLRSLPIFAHDAPLANPYIHNAVLTIPVPPMPASVIQTESIGELALRIRRAIVAYNADPGIPRADLHWRCTESNFFKTLMPCPPGPEYWMQTNLRAARFAELDFSGAAVGNRMGTAVRVVFTCPETVFSFPPLGRGVTMVTMEDEDAVWMCDTRGAKEWERIRQTGEIAFTD
ncbi:hypothetical protein K438DRAFT_1938421 [Mycena galopus ATCC 62051]|nr:hypothetical protein K438DRAFT_1938421 [Mycena galopus ATCC 62051]